MHRPLRFFVGLSALVLLAAGLSVQACHDEAEMAPTGPQLAAIAGKKTLKVSGGGNGAGAVTAPAVGTTASLDCQVSAGSYDPIDCTKTYAKNSTVQLTAVAAPGSVFKEWRNGCTGSAPTCTVRMDVNRAVRAVFRGTVTGSFQLNVAGGGSGGGRITSQSGLANGIDCTLNAGSPSSGTCQATFTSGTAVILSAVPGAGSTFDGWSGDCSGTGTCNLTLSTNRSVVASFRGPEGPEATVGRWTSSRSTPVIGLHLNLLPNGNALLWGHGGQPQVWNQSGGGFTQVADQTCSNPATCELFCAGHTYLADGRLLVAGGHDEVRGNNFGLTQSSIFDGNGWQAASSMTYPRWYPTLTTLANGNVLALSGAQTPDLKASIPEIWNGSTWSQLTGANRGLPLYPRVFVEPKQGHVFLAGERESWWLDPNGAGSWSAGPPRHGGGRNYGSAVMVDSKVLYAGGGGSACPDLPMQSAEVIDLADPSPSWAVTGSMAFRRRQTNLTILPDGTVLMTGGSSQCGFSNESGAVFAAELWNPSTGQWTTLAAANVVRVYHSTTALLPDGRVLSTGGGDGAGATQQFTYEIFSPPYLFKGPRPSYDLASTHMHYGQSFTVNTSDAASIRKVTIIRLASSTHAFEMSARLNTLNFTANGQSLTVQPPVAGRIAPPGPYLLFILNEDGVPSVAQTVLLSQ